VFSETLLRLFGDYARKTNIAAFSQGDFNQGGDQPNSYITQLRKVRLAVANELDDEIKLKVSLTPIH
jgi:hypothetical protein